MGLRLSHNLKNSDYVVSYHEINHEGIARLVEKLASHPLRNEDIQKAANRMLKDCNVPMSKEVQNLQRARYGLAQYLRRSVGPQLEQLAAF